MTLPLPVREDPRPLFQRCVGGRLQSARQLWRGARSTLLLATLGALAAGAAISGAFWLQGKQTNKSIDALRQGADARVSQDAAPELLLARIGFLSKRDEFDAARLFVDALDQTDRNDLRAKAHYLLANALLRRAFDLLMQGQLEPAGPFVNLAKREYRRALQLVPEFWDAKFNYDVASRLVRDYPDLDRTSGDELAADPKKIWTDIPGSPKGLP